MADSKISALPASTTPLAGTEVLPIVQSSTTKQVSVANLTAGRAISATQLTLTTGNVIVASGQGIDFSATSSGSGTMTSELLSDYEEGTFTPAIAFSVSNGNLSYALQVGLYTKIGRCVTFEIALTFGETTASGSIAEITGFPFTSKSGSAAGGGVYTDNMSGLTGAGIWIMGASTTAINVYFSNTGSVQVISTTNLGAASNVIRIAGLYYTA